ncbi:MAG: hypothetical protein JO016_05300 [Actinobacteria bacterium]|nr:hypothetical protein [Actinomycetota bacterium]
MFERFTDRARKTIVQAQEESRALRHDYIGPEHILLALMDDSRGLGFLVLADQGITEARVREQLNLVANTDREPPAGHIPFTPAAKQTLELSLRESLQLSDRYIGTEHILLGLIRQEDNPAADALRELGVTIDDARAQVVRRQTDARAEQGAARRVAAARDQPGAPGGEPDDLGGEVRQARDEPLRQEIGRLRALLQRHGIDPDEGLSNGGAGSAPGEGSGPGGEGEPGASA